jgi:methyltransferase (TIGR00027 family)
MQTKDLNTHPLRPDSTAERTALWRALHLEIDELPHIFEDDRALALLDPPAEWRQRPDMDPQFSATFRGSMVARARFVEDFVAQQAARGVTQYVILGAGLDTFGLRRTDLTASLKVFEVDQPGPQEWKRARLLALHGHIPDALRLVPVDFEGGDSAWHALAQAGFDPARSAVVASTGVSMYLTKEATMTSLRQVAALAPGSSFLMTFMLPVELLPPAMRPGIERAMSGARASGTPFIGFYTPDEIVEMARQAGFRHAEHVSSDMLGERYFRHRTDGLRMSTAEEFLVATT